MCLPLDFCNESGNLRPRNKADRILAEKRSDKTLFPIKDVGTIAGSFMSEGKATRNAKLRVVRNGRAMGEGQVTSLKRFKDDAREVREGFECGLKIAGYDDIKVGDVIEAFVVEKIAATA
jgi:translation initiation factor IF-2